MLKSANLYKGELNSKLAETMYDMKYMYYHYVTSSNAPLIEDDNSYLHSFVSVDESGDILGYICYDVNWTLVSVLSFGAISFVPDGSITYVRDLLQCIDNIFMKYNFNRIEWWAAADNPAIRGYKNLCKRFGGREVGYLRQNTKLMDNKLHDSIIFEIMREDYIKSKGRKK